jgi:hypothetical protein
MRRTVLLSAGVSIALWACASEQVTTEPSSSPNRSLVTVGARSVAEPTIAVHPSKNLEPDGGTVMVIGKGFPANVTVQLSECTPFSAFPLTCQVLSSTSTNEQGMFNARVLVALDLTVINPFPPVPTCAEPTATGVECLFFATVTESPFTSAFTSISFRRK